MSSQPQPQPLSDIMGATLYPELRDSMIRPGEPGRNPHGRPRYKMISDAMLKKLAAPSDTTPGETAADQIAEKVVHIAKSGDLAAVVILRDSTEGRPAQAIQLDANIQTESMEERRSRLFAMIQVLALPQEEP